MTTPKKHWRSLAELEDSPEFRERLSKEFPDLLPDDLEALPRRRFLQLMGASMALAGASSCRWQDEDILPFASRPVDRVPGKAVYFSSAIERSGHGVGVQVSSYDGRPIKVEGNPNDPISGGATDVFAQAAILELYDPDRSRVVRKDGADSSWADFDAFWGPHFKTLAGAKGAGMAILAEANSSPTIGFLQTQMLRKLRSAKWFEYEAISRDNEVVGSRMAFGKAHRAQYDAGQARVIVSFDGDFFSGHPAQLKHNREWAANRRPKDGQMGRLYAAESRFSTDGGMADHRVPMRSGDVPVFLALVESILAEQHDIALETPAERPTGGHGATDERAQSVAKAIAKDLAANTGASILVAGPNQPAEVHARLAHLNAALGNVGRTIRYTNEPAEERASHDQAVRDLIAAIDAGEVSTLVLIEGNPLFDAPADVDLATALAKVEHTIRLGLYDNETSAACGWHLPRTHAFEEWSDATAWDGTHLIGQPTIAPIWGARSLTQFLAPMLGSNIPSADKIIAQMAGLKSKPKDWRRAVHDGVSPKNQLKAANPSLQAPGAFRPVPVGDSIEVTFAPDTKVYDGRYANSSWLQELPDFMTKLTWDNVALVGASTAEKHGVTTGDLLTVTVDGSSLELPVYVQPGQASDSINLQLGYGRTRAGQVGGWVSEDENASEPVGTDVYPLRKAGVFTTTATIAKAAGSYPLAMTQEHHLVDDIGMEGAATRRGDLARERNLEDFKSIGHDEIRHQVHHPPAESLWEHKAYEGHAWAMAIDLSTCNGCNACVVACQSENNIPVVGKQEVMNAREMHWLRIDRYFAGDDPDQPEMTAQPVNCQQCEMAPCEQVCPVAATTHSDDGLNDMVYNRCVGTRYCANNCPFKVRRFNYKNYNKVFQDPENEVQKLSLNPGVTVRNRGVMEKCTFCVQRIQEVKIEAKNAGRAIVDGEITTACAQACPPQAIVFGDQNDPNSKVAAAHGDARAYQMLSELNLHARNQFLAKIRNPHPDLVPAETTSNTNGGH